MKTIDAKNEFLNMIAGEMVLVPGKKIFLERINDYIKEMPGKHPVFNTFSQIRDLNPLELIITDFKHSDVKEICPMPVIAYSETLHNSDPTASVDMTITYEKTMSEEFAFSFDEEIKLGVTTKVKCGIPLIAEGEIEVTGEISAGAHQSWTATKEKSWKGERTIHVNAGSSVSVQVTIQNETLNSSFTAKIFLGPDTCMVVGVSVASDPDSYREFPIPLTVLLGGPEALAQMFVSFSGSFNGTEGVTVDTTVTPIR